MTTVLKIGGSLITDKTRHEALDEAQLSRICSELADNPTSEMILVHGGGSFGHTAAERHGIDTARGTRDAYAIHEIMNAMDRLRRHVVDALLDVGVPAVGLPPRALAVKSGDGDLDLSALAIERSLAAGMLPVLHGDVVFHTGRGATVLSGDALAVDLAVTLDADRVGFCTGVDGVLDHDGSVIPHISDFESVTDVLGQTRGTDVSGGMATKIQALLARDVPGAIFGIDALGVFLAGEFPGTRVNFADTDPF